jgi:rubrerythrin
MKTWVCVICGHRHKGDSPPSVCPECGAHKEMFKEEK